MTAPLSIAFANAPAQFKRCQTSIETGPMCAELRPGLTYYGGLFNW
jgi:hypothetical protein